MRNTPASSACGWRGRDSSSKIRQAFKVFPQHDGIWYRSVWAGLRTVAGVREEGKEIRPIIVARSLRERGSVLHWQVEQQDFGGARIRHDDARFLDPLERIAGLQGHAVHGNRAAGDVQVSATVVRPGVFERIAAIEQTSWWIKTEPPRPSEEAMSRQCPFLLAGSKCFSS